MSSRKPVLLSQVIKDWLESSNMRTGLAKGRLFQEWKSLVGPRISAISTPIDVRGKTLLLEVKDPAWRTELSLMQEKILEVINGYPELPEVKKIRFIGRRIKGVKE